VGRLRRTTASGTGLPGRAGVDVDTTVVGCAAGARASGAGSRPAPTHDAAPGAAAAVTSGRHAALGPASGLTRRTSVGRHG
jgi:hypothetical protein